MRTQIKRQKIKKLIEMIERESGKRVILKEAFNDDNVTDIFEKTDQNGEIDVNWTLKEFVSWCKKNGLKKQADEKEYWGGDIGGMGEKEYYVFDKSNELYILFAIRPDGTSYLAFS